MVTAYYPGGRETAAKIDRIFADKPGLRPAILLNTIVTCCSPERASLSILELPLSHQGSPLPLYNGYVGPV
jgi:hypothetical protein